MKKYKIKYKIGKSTFEMFITVTKMDAEKLGGYPEAAKEILEGRKKGKKIDIISYSVVKEW